MRITYRYKNNKDYWQKRWDQIPADEAMTNEAIYPLKYANICIDTKESKILEAGCGNGRILRYYHNNGYNITGFDFIKTSIEKLKAVDSSLNAEVGDITKLKYKNNSFDYILAFGLYHNLQNNLDDAISETYRILTSSGKVCASFRADNIQTRLTDWLNNQATSSQGDRDSSFFHKMNLKENEFLELFIKHGFKIENIYHVENMPFIYKIPFFRSKTHKNFNENLARNEGYKLSFLGKKIQKIFMKYFSKHFCNIFVIIAKKI